MEERFKSVSGYQIAEYSGNSDVVFIDKPSGYSEELACLDGTPTYKQAIRQVKFRAEEARKKALILSQRGYF